MKNETVSGLSKKETNKNKSACRHSHFPKFSTVGPHVEYPRQVQHHRSEEIRNLTAQSESQAVRTLQACMRALKHV